MTLHYRLWPSVAYVNNAISAKCRITECIRMTVYNNFLQVICLSLSRRVWAHLDFEISLFQTARLQVLKRGQKPGCLQRYARQKQ